MSSTIAMAGMMTANKTAKSSEMRADLFIISVNSSCHLYEASFLLKMPLHEAATLNSNRQVG
jgi:hypothetical protein